MRIGDKGKPIQDGTLKIGPVSSERISLEEIMDKVKKGLVRFPIQKFIGELNQIKTGVLLSSREEIFAVTCHLEMLDSDYGVDCEMDCPFSDAGYCDRHRKKEVLKAILKRCFDYISK